MKFLTLLALCATTTSGVPVVGGITDEIACKDEADGAAGIGEGTIKDCEYDFTTDTDIYKCSLNKPLGDGVITAADWADTKTQCSALFDTEGADRKCVSATYDGAGGGYCVAWMTAEQAPIPEEVKALLDLMLLLFPDYMYGSGLGGVSLAAGSAAATLTAALYM
jgi:hypothetical protein